MRHRSAWLPFIAWLESEVIDSTTRTACETQDCWAGRGPVETRARGCLLLHSLSLKCLGVLTITGTANTGILAGLDVVRLIREPVAAALAYGLNLKEDQTVSKACNHANFDTSASGCCSGVCLNLVEDQTVSSACNHANVDTSAFGCSSGVSLNLVVKKKIPQRVRNVRSPLMSMSLWLLLWFEY